MTSDNIGQYLDAIYIAKFLKLLREIMEDGYGEVNMKIIVQKGKVKAVHVDSSQSYNLASLEGKE